MEIFRNNAGFVELVKDNYNDNDKIRISPICANSVFLVALFDIQLGVHKNKSWKKEKIFKKIDKDCQELIEFLINYLEKTDNENI